MNLIKNEKIKAVFAKLYESNSIFYLVPIVVLSSWLITKGMPTATGYYLIHYLYTYDHGFIPRGLLGEVISWFADTVSGEMIELLATAFSALLIVSSSLCIGKALSKVKENKEYFSWTIAAIAVLCIFPTTFDMQFEAIHLDKLLWVITLFSVFISDNKYGIWLTPVLCAICVLINPFYVFGSMILMAIILLNKFHSSHYSVKNGIICAVSYIAIIAIGLYGTFSQKMTGFSTPNELIDYYFSRYEGQLSEEMYNSLVNECVFDYFEPLNKVLQLSFQYYFIEWEFGINSIFYFVFVSFPIWLFLGSIWKKAMKAEENKFQKFIYFLCLISPLVIIPVFLVGWELQRYFSENFIVQVCLLIYFIVNRHPAVIDSMKSTVEFFKKHAVLAVIAVLHFSLIIVV